MKITIYELLGLIKDGKAPKRVRRYNFDFFRDYELISYTATIHRMYKSEDGTFLMDLVKIDDEVEILDEEDEFIDIEETTRKVLRNKTLSHDESLDGIVHNFNLAFDKINDLIKNQKKIIDKLKEEGK